MTLLKNFLYFTRLSLYPAVLISMFALFITGNLAYAAEKGPTVWDAFMIPKDSTLAKRVYMALWDADKGVREGLVAFVKDDKRCVGRLSLRTKRAKKGPEINFDLVQGENCSEYLGGHFKYDRHPNRHLYLTWYPAGFKPANIQDLVNLKQNNSIALAEAKTTPEFLQELIAGYSSNKNLAQSQPPEQKALYASELESLKTSLQKPLLDHFADADLIGVWKGTLINKQDMFPAQIALWSANVSRFQKLVGVVSFTGAQCTAGAEIVDDGGNRIMGISHVYISTDEGKCVQVEGEAIIQLHASGDMLNLYLETNQNKAGSIQKKHCLPDLLNGCYAAGVFKRARASQKLQNTMATTRWKYINPPDADTWAVIKDNQPVPENIKAMHTRLAAKNEQTLEQIKREDEQEKQQRIARYRAEIAAEKQQKIDARNAEKRLAEIRAGTYSGDVITKPEVVKGPFDGLSGSSFLNALYHGDFASIDRQTRAYQELKVKQRSDFLGNQPHWSDDIQNAAFRSIRLIDTVYGIYLFNYQSNYSNCLGSDAVTFKVTETTPDVVITNGLGWEVARYYGSTNITHFKINPEFTEIFRRIGRTKPDSISMGFADLLMGGGGIDLPEELTSRDPMMNQLGNILKGKGERDLRNQLRSGTREMMQKFDCNSAEIKQLESNMVRARK